MLLWVALSLVVYIDCRTEEPIVHTVFGDVRGFTYKTQDGFEADVFLGLPYARPPLDDYRFEKPEAVSAWKPSTLEAKQLAPSCVPATRGFFPRLANYSEDCLYLNIMIPKKRSSALLPSLVFIHGGAFVLGTPEWYGYESPVENFVRNGVIFVTVNYRLGPFGFFSTGDGVMPGNLGLWDQTRALLFLHDVLPAFGGDVDRITLSGQSAGSASVSAHLFSPHSEHLFSQAVQFSGSLLSEWAIGEGVIKESKDLASALGCDTSNSKTIHDCMKSQPFDNIMDKLDRQELLIASPRLTRFNPRVDNDFFPYPLEDIVRKAQKKRTLNFVTDMESAIFVIEQYNGMHVSKDKWKIYGREDLLDYIRDYVIQHEEFGRRTSPFFVEVMEFYANRGEQNTSSFYLTRLAELISDLQFNVPIVHEVDLKRINGWETYFAVLDYDSESIRNKEWPIRGAWHSMEHRYILTNWPASGDAPFNEDDKKLKDNLLSGVLSFIKTGEPKSGTIEWPKVTGEHPRRNLRVRPEPVVSEEFRHEAIDFWTKRVPEVVGRDLLKKTRLPSTEARQKHSEL